MRLAVGRPHRRSFSSSCSAYLSRSKCVDNTGLAVVTAPLLAEQHHGEGQTADRVQDKSPLIPPASPRPNSRNPRTAYQDEQPLGWSPRSIWQRRSGSRWPGASSRPTGPAGSSWLRRRLWYIWPECSARRRRTSPCDGLVRGVGCASEHGWRGFDELTHPSGAPPDRSVRAQPRSQDRADSRLAATGHRPMFLRGTEGRGFSASSSGGTSPAPARTAPHPRLAAEGAP